jgi:hypothetical protein
VVTTAPTTREASAEPGPAVRKARRVGFGAVVVDGVVFGAFLHAWYLGHSALDSDEAVAGMIAEAILHGHNSTFFWGSIYGGTAEQYVVAALFALFGASALVLNATAALLAAVAAVLTWRVARRLVRAPWVAAMAGLLTWVGPEAWLSYSTTEEGFRRVTMIAGLACVLYALRILDGKRRPAEFVGLGLAAGIGWWSSPELAYFFVPTAGLLVAAVVGRGADTEAARRWVGRAGLVVGSFVVAAAPWFYDNLRSGFASLQRSRFPSRPSSYGSRLGSFFEHTLRIDTNLSVRYSGAPPLGGQGTPTWEHALLILLVGSGLAALVGAVLLCLASWGRAAAIAAGVLAYPFVYAENPATWFWQDARYGCYLVPLLALLLACGVDQAAARMARTGRTRRRPGAHRARRRAEGRAGSAVAGWAPTAMAGLVVLSAALTLVCLQQFVGGEVASAAPGTGRPSIVRILTTGWRRPGDPARQQARALEAAGITRGYADYWDAYDLDFVAGGRLDLVGMPLRPHALAVEAERGSGQAWLFWPQANPAGVDEAQLIARLRRLGVGYRIVVVGAATAVIPARPVPPSRLAAGWPDL